MFSIIKFLGLVLALYTPFAFADMDCIRDCVTAYGSVLGKTEEGIIVYSNCNRACTYMTKEYSGGFPIYVSNNSMDFVRRFLNYYGYEIEKFDNEQTLRPSQWYFKDTVVWLGDQREKDVYSKLLEFKNGSPARPLAGDILFGSKRNLIVSKEDWIETYDMDDEDFHVGIISKVEMNKKPEKISKNTYRVGVAYIVEQNYSNSAWNGTYSRKIDIIKTKGDYFLSNENQEIPILSWKRIPGFFSEMAKKEIPVVSTTALPSESTPLPIKASFSGLVSMPTPVKGSSILNPAKAISGIVKSVSSSDVGSLGRKSSRRFQDNPQPLQSDSDDKGKGRDSLR